MGEVNRGKLVAAERDGGKLVVEEDNRGSRWGLRAIEVSWWQGRPIEISWQGRPIEVSWWRPRVIGAVGGSRERSGNFIATERDQGKWVTGEADPGKLAAAKRD